MNEPLGAEYGRYDDICQSALCMAWDAGARATGALLIIVGDKGSSGFSVSATDPRVLAALPNILREVAQGIEEQAGKQQ